VSIKIILSLISSITFITYGIQHKIAGTFAITGHETDVVDGLGKISQVAKGYWTQAITDNILEKQTTIERFDFGDFYFMPACFNLLCTTYLLGLSIGS
jgi:hypothetical protein